MRSLLSLTALLVLVGVASGCGDDNKNTMPDLAMSVADMSAAPMDMAKIPTCAAALSCVANCGANATCAGACQTNASAAAQQYLVPFELCVFTSCGTAD